MPSHISLHFVLIIKICCLICSIASVDGRLPAVDTRGIAPAAWDSNTIIPEGYNRLIPPRPGNGEPVQVRISLNITQILSIKEDEQSFTVHCHYSQRWIDTRLTIPDGAISDSLGLDYSWKQRIWSPDTYFHNAIEGKGINILASPYNFVLKRDSEVTMTLRTVLTLTCDMNLHLFPHDTQVCNIILVSLSHEKRDVIFLWDNFDLLQQVDFPKFIIEKVESGDCDQRIRPGYYCIKASIQLKRRWEYYAIRVYGPSLLLVITSFIGFWIPVIGYPARVLIIVTPLLSLVTQQTQLNAEINVSYVVALHIWMMACTFFVFMALLELAFAVVYVHQLEDKKIKNAAFEESSIQSSTLTVPDDYKRRFSTEFKNDLSHWLKNLLVRLYGQIDWSKAPLDRNKIDYIARICFPSLFFLFVCVYAITLYKHIE